jgi:hypothetical protein
VRVDGILLARARALCGDGVTVGLGPGAEPRPTVPAAAPAAAVSAPTGGVIDDDDDAPAPLYPWDLHTASVASALDAVDIDDVRDEHGALLRPGIRNLIMHTTRGRSRAAGAVRADVHLAQLLTHAVRLFRAAMTRADVARGRAHHDVLAAASELDRAIKLLYLLPSLLYSSDGRLRRQQRVGLLARGDLGTLVQWQIQYARVRASTVQSDDPPSDAALQAAAAAATAYAGGVHKGAQLLTGEERTPRTITTFELLVRKHPLDDIPSIQAAVAAGRAEVAARGAPVDLSFCTPERVHAVLMAANPLSAAGPSGLRYCHCQDAARATGGRHSDLVAELARLWHEVLASPDVLPATFWALHSSATLSALGVDKARPIACGDVLRRLISSATLDALGERLGPALRDAGQYGVAVPSGVEHVATRVASAHESGDWVFALDGRNAFNELRRAAMLRTAATMLPEAFEYICHMYAGDAPHLLYQLAAGDIRVVPSQRGAQQGDPFGPALYCCGIHAVLQQYAATASDARSDTAACAFMDDIFGRTAQLDDTWLGAVRHLVADLQAVGITIRPDKSFVLAPQGHTPTVEELARVRAAGLTPAAAEGITCVGVPVGSDDFVRQVTTESIQRLNCTKLARHLAAMKDHTQPAMLLSTQSLSRRMGFLGRNVDPLLAAPAFDQYDALNLWTMEHIMGLPGAASPDVFFGSAGGGAAPPPLAAAHLVLAPHQRMQVQMSLRSGGLHVASAVHCSDAAFVGCQLVTLPSMLADLAGGASAPWLTAAAAARLPATARVRALRAAIQRLSARGVPRDRLYTIIPPSWVAWALDAAASAEGGGAPSLCARR